MPVRRQARQFPGPVADDATAAHARAAESPQRVRQIGAVVMHDQAAGAGRDRAAVGTFNKLGLAEGRTQVEGGGYVTGGFQRGVSQARAFADATGGREQAGDAERKSAERL